MRVVEFALPDVGEGLTEAEILNWLVAEGESVAVNDLLVEVETAKAVVELPSPVAGTVLSIHVPAAKTVPVGTIIVTLEDPSDLAGDAPPVADGEASDRAAEHAGAQDSSIPDSPTAEAKPLVLVGTGPSAPRERRRRLGGAGARPTRVPGAASVPASVPATNRSGDAFGRPRAKPPVRALARSLNIDLAIVPADATGIISREAVLAAADAGRDVVQDVVSDGAVGGAPTTDEDRRIPVRGVRKVIAEAMVRSAFTAPHVTVWLSVDVTPTMELLARLKANREYEGVRLNAMAMVARAFLLAIRRNPEVNASWDDAAHEIVQYRHVNLGIAAATPRGLLVPNIRSADTLDFAELAGALGALVDSARSGATSPADMSGGTITITNIGALGLDAGTPILNPGEAAILAFGAIRKMPWVVGDELRARDVTQLALSFDHRLVDGELGAAVLTDLGQILSDPAAVLTMV